MAVRINLRTDEAERRRREYLARWHEEHREELRIKAREWRAEHASKVRAKNRAYYNRNRYEINERQRERYASDEEYREHRKELVRACRERKKALVSTP